MRYGALTVSFALMACGPIHASSYKIHYDVVPRKIVLTAIDAARELDYAIVAVESPDVNHNMFLALKDQRAGDYTALVVNISWLDQACPPVGCGTIDTPTQVAITPLAFHHGKPLSEAQVPPEARANAEQLLNAIYDRQRQNRHMFSGL